MDKGSQKRMVLQIDNEVILYSKKEGNKFTGLQKRASGTVILPTFTTKAFLNSVPAAHTKAPVKNVFGAFLGWFSGNHLSILCEGSIQRELLQKSIMQHFWRIFVISSNQRVLNLVIKALFKILFAENDVDVTYPGDRMIIPSKST